MLRSLRRHTPVLLTAVIVATLMQVGPPVVAAAYDAVNADKVDGRHAVGAAASPTKRAGKLVATNAQGRLPDSIIAKAPDAAKLGGVAPDGYLRNEPMSVGSEQLMNNDVQLEDLSYAARLPRAFGLVVFDGTVHSTRPFNGITTENVTKPESPVGTYCIHGLDFSPSTVSVSPSLVQSGPGAAWAQLGAGPGCEEVEGTQITVTTWSVQTDQPNDASFDIQVWSGS